MSYERIIQSIKEFLRPFSDEFGIPFINFIQITIDKYNLNQIYKGNKRGFIFGVTIATLVFVVVRSKTLKSIKSKIIPDKDLIDEEEAMGSIRAIMKHENIEFEAAKEILIANELATHLRISKNIWIVSDKKAIHACDKVSFKDKEIGNVSGYFIGLVSPDYLFYDDIYVMRLRDGSLRQAPISCIDTDTIYVYKNSRYTFEE